MAARTRAAVWGIVGAAAAMTVAACSAPGTAGTGVVWTEPAWFAEHVAAQEAAETAFDGCMHDKGWAPRHEDGHWDVQGADADRFWSEADACNASLGFDPRREMSEAEHRQFFRYLVDIHECLIAHGLPEILAERGLPTMVEPPSEESWIDQVLAGDMMGFWHPYSVLGPGLTDPEYSELTQTCPQPFMP